MNRLSMTFAQGGPACAALVPVDQLAIAAGDLRLSVVADWSAEPVLHLFREREQIVQTTIDDPNHDVDVYDLILMDNCVSETDDLPERVGRLRSERPGGGERDA